ncbi:MAG: glycosyltransferase [bacterium]
MIKILFIHPNFPGQFKHIIPALQQNRRYSLAYISRKRSMKGVEDILIEQYEFEKSDPKKIHRYLHYTQDAVREAQKVSIAATRLAQKGFIPDLIVGHVGWGGLLFMKDLFPQAKTIAYCELYFSEQYDHAALPGEQINNDRKAFLRCRNLHTLMQMQSMDVGITPTRYQLESHPDSLRSRMVTVHEGVDSALCCPDPDAHFPIKDKGLLFGKNDTVITYVSRGFEPARGFFQLMESIELLCDELPDAHFLLVGGDKSFYSGDPGVKSYRQQALEKYKIDPDRVHFTGRLVHEGFRRVAQISSAHIYLTRPLFLSWSVVEAMSMGAPIVASDESLVREFMTHEQDALLVDYFSPRDIADSVNRLVKDKDLARRLGENARQKITEQFDIQITVSKWLSIIERLENPA